MRSGFLISFVVAALTMACGATQEREAVDPSSDPAWTPPGQGDLDVADSKIVEKAKAKPRPRHLQEPNHRQTRPLVGLRP